jgi:hypothetical protein
MLVIDLVNNKLTAHALRASSEVAATTAGVLLKRRLKLLKAAPMLFIGIGATVSGYSCALRKGAHIRYPSNRDLLLELGICRTALSQAAAQLPYCVYFAFTSRFKGVGRGFRKVRRLIMTWAMH